MAWYDGTTEYSEDELEGRFPVKVTDDIYLTEDGKKLAIINSFESGTALYDLSDPHAETGDKGEYVFYHAFSGEAAAAAERAIEDFISNADLKDGRSVTLFRQEPDSLFSYAYGHICTGLLRDQNRLRSVLPEGTAGEEKAFILPLKRFMFRCPVCGQRTLPERGRFFICGECGWEDEGMDDDDAEPAFGPNGDYTIREYREEYLKLKAENPNYKWSESD